MKPIVRYARRFLLDDLRQADSWADLEERLARHQIRLRLARWGSGIVLERGEERVGLSEVHWAFSGPALTRRFHGQTLRSYRANAWANQVRLGSNLTGAQLR